MLNLFSGDETEVYRLGKEFIGHFYITTDASVAHLLNARMEGFYSRLVDEIFHVERMLWDVDGSQKASVLSALHMTYLKPGKLGALPDHHEYVTVMGDAMGQVIPPSICVLIVEKSYWSKLRTSYFDRTTPSKRSPKWRPE